MPKPSFRLCAALALCQAAFAAAPLITELQPRGAERGRPFTLTVVGRNLGEGARITSSLPAQFTPLSPAMYKGEMMAPGRKATFLVEPKKDVPVGVYPVRVETPDGISNVLLFAVGSLPETNEQESLPGSLPHKNDSIETAEPVQSAPVTLNGTLRGPERDVFRVHGKAGERRVFEVEARRCGSAIDPVIRILDAAGQPLARNEDAPGLGLDARLDFTFPKEGNYYVELHDARFSRQSQNFYRLKMGSYPYAEDLFPLGGRRGEVTEVSFSGGRLTTPAVVRADLRAIDPQTTMATVSLPDSPGLPLPFAVSDLPEMREPVTAPVTVPAVINGRLSKETEADRYRVTVKPGEQLVFEVQARDLGTSKLNGLLTLTDANGKKLASAGDDPIPINVFAAVQNQAVRNSVDPFLYYTVPKDVTEVTVAVEDIALRGGPGYSYRLLMRQRPPDFELTISTPYVNIPAHGTAMVNVALLRRGYQGPIQIKVENAPQGVTVEGGFVPAEEEDPNNLRTQSRRGALTLTAAPGAQFAPQQLTVVAEGVLPDGTVLRRRARGPGLAVDVTGAVAQGVVDRQRPVTAPWLGMELPVALTTEPSARLELQPIGVERKASGDEYKYRWTWTPRQPDQTLPDNVTVDIVGARDTRVINMQPDGKTSGTFIIATTKATVPAKYDLFVSGKLTTRDGTEDVVSRRTELHVLEDADAGKSVTTAAR